MPMVDYQCEECGYRFENFYHSDPPDSQRCPRMGEESPCLGYAPRINSLPGEYRPTNAKRFDPIVIWVNNENPDQISFPGRANEQVQEGYHAVEITNLPQADYWTRRINRIENEKAQANWQDQKAYWDAVTKERRDEIRAKIGGNARAQALFKMVQQYIDAKRERRWSRSMDTHGHFQVVSFDSSNRQGYADHYTDWKERKA